MGSSNPEPVSFGLYLPQVNRDYRELLSLTRTAEACGFSAVWFMDHLMLPGTAAPVLEGWTLATAVAAATSRIRIGHLVLCDSFRHPVLLGSMAATLDQISGGRLNLGMGWGWSREEIRLFDNMARGPAERAAKLAESIKIVRAILGGETMQHHGEHFTVGGIALALHAVQEHVPVFIGGASQRTLQLVRDHGDWWNCPALERRRLTELTPQVRGARISVNYSLAFSTRRQNRPPARTADGTESHLTRTPDEITEILRADRELGVEHFIIQFTDAASAPADIESFMAEVAPAVRNSRALTS